VKGAHARTIPRGLMAVLIAGCVATVADIAFPHLTVVRTVVGVPFLLYGQGYALMRALFARRDLPELSARVMLALALSLASIVVVGLALGAADVPLTGSALVISLLVVTFIAVAVSVIRDPFGSVPELNMRVGEIARSRWLWSMLIACATFILLLVVLSRPLPNKAVAGYTDLWALRAAGGDITVGVQNEQQSRAAYRVVASGVSSGKRVSVEFTLSPGRRVTRVLAVGQPPLQTVDVRLYLLSKPTQVYREVTLRA
jgi:Protein of unknown function (DUF1616)